MEKEKKEKRILRVELEDEVKHVSITGLGSDEKVVMRQELNEEELDQATGGIDCGTAVFAPCVPLKHKK